jgi:hypothetical protein
LRSKTTDYHDDWGKRPKKEQKSVHVKQKNRKRKKLEEKPKRSKFVSTSLNSLMQALEIIEESSDSDNDTTNQIEESEDFVSEAQKGRLILVGCYLHCD